MLWYIFGFANFPAFLYIYRRAGWSQSFPLKIFFSCSLGGGGGRSFSVPCCASWWPKLPESHLKNSAVTFSLKSQYLGRTPTGACNDAPFSEGFLEGFSRLLSRRFSEGFLEGALQWGFSGKKGS